MIYFVAARGTECIKIGMAKNVKKRLSSLAIGCPYELFVVKTFQPRILSDAEVERWFHHHFKRSYIRGEWFAITSSDIENAIAIFEEHENAPAIPVDCSSFMGYLIGQRKRLGLVGDLARDVDESEGDGIQLNTFLQWRQYLRNYGACAAALNAVALAWWEYRRIKRAR